MRAARFIVFLVLIGLAFATAFVLKVPLIEGQQTFPQPNRKPSCTCFCGDSTFDSFRIFSAADVAAGKCYGGPLPADVCGTELADLPPAQVQQLCSDAKAKGKICPALKPFCKEGIPPTGQGCHDAATPWFGDSPGCKDVQAPVVAVVRDRVNVSICGLAVFSGANPVPGSDAMMLDAYKFALVEQMKDQVGSKICCDKLREAARTGNPCDVTKDIDCDGRPNLTDVTATEPKYPDINLYTIKSGAPVDPFPLGLDPDDPNFMPESTARDSKGVGECPCKWELVKGTLACSPDGRKDHLYTATWRCPSNGKEIFTTKSANATAPCNRSHRAGVMSFPFDSVYRLRSFTDFVTSQMRVSDCD